MMVTLLTSSPYNANTPRRLSTGAAQNPNATASLPVMVKKLPLCLTIGPLSHWSRSGMAS